MESRRFSFDFGQFCTTCSFFPTQHFTLRLLQGVILCTTLWRKDFVENALLCHDGNIPDCGGIRLAENYPPWN